MNKKRFLAIVLELFLALIFFSCKHSVSDSVDYEKKDNLVKVSFSVEGFDSPERLITPTGLTAGSELIEKYELIGECSDAPSGAKNTTIEKTFEQTSKSAYSQLQSYKPKLYHGKWNFTLKAYGESFSKPGELQEISESLILEFEVSSTNNKITFGMQEYNGEGKYDFTIKFPKDGAKAAKYCFSSLNGTDFSDASLETVTIEEDDDTTRSKIHLSNPVSNGLYFIRVYFYSDDAATNIISKRTIYFRVVTGLTTSQIINLDEINTPYTINYELNGGSFSPQYSMITDFNTSMNVTLPTKDNLVYSTDYTKGFFEGWYTTKEFDETSKITGWNAGEYSQDVTVYAKWTYSKVYLDPENGDDDNSGASPDKAVKSFEKAKSLLKATFPQEETYSDYGIYVCSTIALSIDETTLSLDGYTANNLFRYSTTEKPFTDPIIEIKSNTITLEKIVIDGGAILEVAGDKKIKNNGLSASAPAVYVEKDAKLVLENVTIQNNANQSGSGGGIGVTGTLEATDSSFTNNYTAQRGGGICLQVDNSVVPCVNLNNCYITYNYATLGGGVGKSENDYPVVFKMNEGNISNNIAYSKDNNKGNGGGIHVITNDGDGVLENVVVENNYSSGNGGGIFVPALKKLHLISCTVQNNKSGGYGAGIYSTGHTRINGKTIISHNEKDDGNLSNLYITGSASDNQISPINNNDYDISGSEIYVSVDQSKKTRTINGYQITKNFNFATNPGCFYSDYGEDYRVELSNDNNLYIYVDPKTFYVNSDSTGTGTALYPCKTIQSAFDIIKGFNDGSSKYTIILNSDCSPDFSKENAQNVYSNTTHYSYLNLESDKNLNLIIKSDLTQQKTIKAVSPTSEISHRAIYVGQNVNLTLENVKVTGGNCTETDESNGAVNGAGIYIENGATCVLTEGTTINENKSVENGGGIYNDGFLTLYDCNISNNTAASGNGIYNPETRSITFAVNNLPSEITISDFIYSDKNSEDSYNLFYSLDGTVDEPVETTSIYLPSLNLCLQEYKKDTIVIQNLCGVSPGSVTTENITLYNSDGKINYSYMLQSDAFGNLLIADKYFTNAEDLIAYLQTLPQDSECSVKVDVGSSELSSISEAISDTLKNTNQVKVNLDLSTCTGITDIKEVFKNNKYLSGIILPNSTTTINNYAFYNCSALTSITIPSSVTSIGSSAFNGCSALTSITIPSSVTSIGASAFEGCSALTSITIPSSVTSIGAYIFSGCSSLSSIVVDTANTKFDSREDCNAIISTANNTLFTGCKNTVIPSSVTTIGDYAFYGCSTLTSITIPTNVTSIYRSAFEYCSGLTSVTIPKSVTTIGDYAFEGCDALKTVNYLGTKAEWDTLVNNNQNHCIPTDAKVNCLGDSTYVFEDTTLLQTYLSSLPTNDANNPYTIKVKTTELSGVGDLLENTSIYINLDLSECDVESIPESSFDSCSCLIGITLPNSVTEIKSLAFNNCDNLQKITIPTKVTSIGGYAFKDILSSAIINYEGTESEWNSITIGDDAIPSGVTINCLGTSTFTTTDSLSAYLKTLSVEGEPYDIKISGNEITLYNIDQLLEGTNTNPNGVKVNLDLSEYTGCTDGVFSTELGGNIYLASIIIPNKVESIADHAINGCRNLTTIVIPNNVKTIGANAFADCNNLTTITIADGVESIGTNAFVRCVNLSKITIPGSVKSIGAYAFVSCNNLTTITIADGVESIGSQAFAGCTALTTMTLSNSVESIGASAFGACSNLKTVNYIGTTTEWNTLLNDSSSHCIPTYAEDFIVNCLCDPPSDVFEDTELLQTYLSSLPSNNASNPYTIKVKTTDLSDVLEIIKNSPLFLNLDLSSCDTIETLVEEQFKDCKKLVSITLPDSIKTINNYVFRDLENLTSIVIPDNVESIGEQAFSGCSKLQTITLPSQIKTIESLTFENCTELKTLIIPDGVTTIKDYVFSGCTNLTNITIPKSVNSIGSNLFTDCSAFGTIYYESTEDDWNSITIDDTAIPLGVTINYSGSNTIPGTPLSSLYDGAAPKTIKNKPSSGETYKLSSTNDLTYLATLINAGNDCSGVTFNLANDVTLEDGWTPIGTNVSENAKCFKGTFDGNGYSVKGLKINSNSGDPQNGKALFGSVSGAIIKNLTVNGVIETNTAGDLLSNYAGIVGVATGNTIIENCISNVTISGTVALANVGGIVGKVEGGSCTITNCINNGTLLSGSTAASNVGGIVGLASGNSLEIVNCANNGDVYAKEYKAGFVGYCNSENLTIKNCTNIGNIIKINQNDNKLAGIVVIGTGVSSSNILYSYYSDQNEEIGALVTGDDPSLVFAYDTSGLIMNYEDHTSLLINSVDYVDRSVLSALNAWIEWSEGGNDPTNVTYKKWKYDANGKLAFE